MNKNFYRLLNYILSTVGWLACAVGAARGWAWVGVLLVLIAMGLHLYVVEDRRKETIYILLATLLGTGMDTLLAATDFVRYQGGYPGLGWLAPAWISAMWLLFAVQLNASLGWLQGRYPLAALMGAFGGPMAYFAGERIGAISINAPQNTATLLLALVWGIAVPGVLWVQARVMGNPAG